MLVFTNGVWTVRFSDLAKGARFKLTSENDASYNFLPRLIYTEEFSVLEHNSRTLNSKRAGRAVMVNNPKRSTVCIIEDTPVQLIGPTPITKPQAQKPDDNRWPGVGASFRAYLEDLLKEQVYSGGQDNPHARSLLIEREKRRGKLG